MMTRVGICFKLPDLNGSQALYLFPSLSKENSTYIYNTAFSLCFTSIPFLLESMKFSIAQTPFHQFIGLRVIAPQDVLFLPGFVCQLIVQILEKLNISSK